MPTKHSTFKVRIENWIERSRGAANTVNQVAGALTTLIAVGGIVYNAFPSVRRRKAEQAEMEAVTAEVADKYEGAAFDAAVIAKAAEMLIQRLTCDHGHRVFHDDEYPDRVG